MRLFWSVASVVTGNGSVLVVVAFGSCLALVGWHFSVFPSFPVAGVMAFGDACGSAFPVPPGGGPLVTLALSPPSSASGFGTKLFIEAQAWISVPSTVKCSSDSSGATLECARIAARNFFATSASSRRSRFFE